MSKEQVQDPGLGAKYSKRTKRLINKDGSFNVVREGVGLSTRNTYHYLINISWGKFLLWVVLTYVLVNSFFALTYMISGLGDPMVDNNDSLLLWFFHCFFFSVQTFTTVGYGALAPHGLAANIIASIEALIGLMGFALATGLFYGRFSQASARMAFTTRAIIAPHKDKNALMIRLANTRKSQLYELEATMMLTQIEQIDEKSCTRKYFSLPLDVDKISFFPLSWTLVHTFDLDSPFYGKSEKEIKDLDVEVLVIVKGFDETFGQTVYARNSFTGDEIDWGKKFDRPFHTKEDGNIVLDLNKLEDSSNSSLN